jgi:uncharacterized alpha-E superfamily protein
MERADSLLRVVETNYTLSLDKGVMSENHAWRSTLELFISQEEKEISSLENNTEAALYKLLLDQENINSLKVIISRARENARGVQDNITKEVWEEVNQIYHLVNHLSTNKNLTEVTALGTIDELIERVVLYVGVTDNTMPRGLGWSFMNLGKYIERCLLTVEMTNQEYASIKYNLNESRDILQWRHLLLSLSGYELHLKNYTSSDYNKNVLHQVLFNHDFTRSVVYSLERILKYLKDITDENVRKENTSLIKSLHRLHSSVNYIDFESINSDNLPAFLSNIKIGILEFTKKLEQIFFSYY